MNRHMPKINLVAVRNLLSDADYRLAERIVNSRTGELRASKPPVPRQIEVLDAKYGTRYDYENEADAELGIAAYVWRMVAFSVSIKSEHHCMPCTAEFDLPGSWNSTVQKAAIARADAIIRVIVDSVPSSEWHGVTRWGQAFGVIGTPRYNDEGAVVYR
jgi:hypothetical protein